MSTPFEKASLKGPDYALKEAGKMAARFFSWIGHPLFVPFFVAWLILYPHPIFSLFLESDTQARLLAMVGINTVLFPAAVVFLLWRLNFVPNIYLDTKKDRIIPLTVSIIFYFWAFWVTRNLDYVPDALQQWLLGVFLASCLAMMLNIYLKVSLHTIGMGGAIAFMVICLFTLPYWPVNWVVAALIIAGIVGTSRLALNAHTPTEIYLGYAAGMIAQMVAWGIVG